MRFGACLGGFFFFLVVKMNTKTFWWQSTCTNMSCCGNPWIPVSGSGSQLCPVLQGKGHCHVGMMLDPAGKFPISHHRVTEPPPAAAASPHLSLVQLELCQIILLNILFPAHSVRQKWRGFSSFEPKERFPFSSRILWQLFQRRIIPQDTQGQGVSSCSSVCHPAKSP